MRKPNLILGAIAAAALLTMFGCASSTNRSAASKSASQSDPCRKLWEALADARSEKASLKRDLARGVTPPEQPVYEQALKDWSEIEQDLLRMAEDCESARQPN